MTINTQLIVNSYYATAAEQDEKKLQKCLKKYLKNPSPFSANEINKDHKRYEKRIRLFVPNSSVSSDVQVFLNALSAMLEYGIEVGLYDNQYEWEDSEDNEDKISSSYKIKSISLKTFKPSVEEHFYLSLTPFFDLHSNEQDAYFLMDRAAQRACISSYRFKISQMNPQEIDQLISSCGQRILKKLPHCSNKILDFPLLLQDREFLLKYFSDKPRLEKSTVFSEEYDYRERCVIRSYATKVEKRGHIITLLDERLQNDRQLMLTAVKNDPHAYKFVLAHFKEDAEFIDAYIQNRCGDDCDVDRSSKIDILKKKLAFLSMSNSLLAMR